MKSGFVENSLNAIWNFNIIYRKYSNEIRDFCNISKYIFKMKIELSIYFPRNKLNEIWDTYNISKK
jgi:hypothetical protein